MQLTLVTGNKHKLKEWQRLVPAEFALENVDIDLAEIQSLDLIEIITDKVKRAYQAVGKPVIVEDVWAGLDGLEGLPGPFIKYFEQRLGMDALFQLATGENDPATVRTALAYYDGSLLLTVEAAVQGTVTAKRGSSGFGFDCCFVPSGQAKTYAEMSPSEKDNISHRGKAIRELIQKLQQQLSKQ